MLALCVAGLLAGLTQPHRAAAQHANAPASPCAEAIHAAELRHGLPPGLLYAIGEVESGRLDAATGRSEPWPWTVQSSDQSLYFASKSEAVQWVRGAMARGVTSIDIGCLQISMLYHPRAFDTLDEAFEPRRNADYAARFLRQLYVSTGDWRKTTGFYHSQISVLAAPYEMRVARQLSGLRLQWPGAPKPPTTFVRLVSAWHATLAPADSSAPPAGSDWSVLLHERPSSAAVLHPSARTK